MGSWGKEEEEERVEEEHTNNNEEQKCENEEKEAEGDKRAEFCCNGRKRHKVEDIKESWDS